MWRVAASVPLVVLLAMPGRAADEPSAQDGTLILDETAWHRSYVQFGIDRISPGQLKSEEAARLLGPTVNLLKREVKRNYGLLGKAWDDAAEKGGWMDEAYVLYRQGQAADSDKMGRMMILSANGPPPADWTAPDFDDGSWPRLRRSLMAGRPAPVGGDTLNEIGRRAGYFRYAFEVPDPAKAGTLGLRLVYHGGARVFLNGTEIARRDLPQGEITAETRATDYPVEAYVQLEEDGTMVKFGRGSFKNHPFFLGDIYGSFDDAPGEVDPKTKTVLKVGRNRGNGRKFDRANWERIQKVRDRVLGPLALPTKLLLKGTNILAVEVRVADLHPVTGGYTVWRDPFVLSNYWQAAWFHAQLVRMELRCRGGNLPSMRVRPEGVQVWAEDMHHRVFSTDFSNPSAGTGTLRFVGAVNGEFGGQVVVGTDRAIQGLKATPSELKLADGSATIPATAISVGYMVGYPVTEMAYLANAASGGRDPSRRCTPVEARNFLTDYGPPELQAKVKGLTDQDALKEATELAFFDHISPVAPEVVPAGSCQPLWVTLRVSSDAKAGVYQGRLRVAAQGMLPVEMPVEADVIGWRVPDRPDWQMVTALEQSPYGVAEHYKVPLWSDEHFRLMEPSVRELARVGNKWLFIPVLRDTELGNLGDSMVKWTRKKDGTLVFDYTIMDRYIALATKHWGKPRVICFYVMHGGAAKVEVPVLNEATGQVESYEIAKSPTYESDWKAFGKALYEHMKARGLSDVMYFGYAWDGESDAALGGILAAVAPGVNWASGSHGYTLTPRYRAQSQIYGADYNEKRRQGWKRSDVYLLNPRGGGSVLTLGGGTGAPALFRMLSDRALGAGCNGVARMAADYWEGMYFRGCRAWQYLIPGMGLNSWMLWPGPQGAQSSQRFEALREGIIECEARIFIEQAIDRGYLDPVLAKKAESTLIASDRELYFIPVTQSDKFACQFSGWQPRMRRLFQVAAEVAGAVGLDTDLSAIQATMPARGKKEVRVRLRNWSDQPREWQAQADQPWIVPKAASGKLTGWDDLVVTLDATQFDPLAKAKGTLSITDTATGKARKLSVAADVTAVLAFTPPNSDTARQWWEFKFLPDKGCIPYNIAPGATETQEAMVLNRSAAEIGWRAAVSAPWIRVEPADGKVAPESALALKITAVPPAKSHAAYSEAVTIAEVNGPTTLQLPLAIHVVPPYQKPQLPPGQAVPLDEALYKSTLKAYRGATGGSGGIGPAELKGTRDKRLQKEPFVRCVRGGTPYEAVFDIAGKGFTGFSAHVGFPEVCCGVVGLWFGPAPDVTRIYYEIHVDGELRAQSGVMGPKDGFRLITVDRLGDAKELRLVARPAVLPGGPITVYWLDPAFYRGR